MVLSKVTRINRRLCTTEIVQIGDHPLAVPFQGVIRVQDVRASEIDKVCSSASHLKHTPLTGAYLSRVNLDGSSCVYKLLV